MITIDSIPSCTFRPMGHYRVFSLHPVTPIYKVSCPPENQIEAIRSINGSFDADRCVERIFTLVPPINPDTDAFFCMKLHRVTSMQKIEEIEILTDGVVYWNVVREFNNACELDLTPNMVRLDPADYAMHWRYYNAMVNNQNHHWPGADVVQEAIANYAESP